MRNLAAAITVAVLGIGYMIGLTVYLVAAILGSSRTLDPVLVPLGLIPQSHMLAGRRYEGTIDGRQVEILYTPAQGTGPAVFDVYIIADIGTRMTFGRQRPLLNCRDCPRIEADQAAWGDVQVFARDETYLSNLGADETARDTLTRLMVGQEELYLQPRRGTDEAYTL